MKKLLTLILLSLVGYACFAQSPTSVYWLKSRVDGSVPTPVAGWGSIYFDYVANKWKFCNGTSCYDLPTSSSGGTVTTRNNLPPSVHTSSFTLSPSDTSKMHILSGGSGAIVITAGTFSGLSGKGLQFAFRRDRADTVYFDDGSETIIQSPGATLGVADSTFAYLYYNGTTDKFYLANGGSSGGGSSGGGGTVESVVAGNLIDVDATDPANPIVSVETGDKGDITIGSNTLTIDNNAVTFAKMQAIGDNTILGASGGTAVEQISISSPLTLISNNLGIQQATTAQDGFLSSTNWNTFNGKQNSITFGIGVLTALGVNIGSAGAPVLFNGALGTPSSGVGTNLTGTASGLTAGNVTTNANLTGHVTSTGNAAVLGSFSSSNLSTALTDEVGTGSTVFSEPDANTQTASYTLVLADKSKEVRMNVAGANNLTVPLNATVAFPVGTLIAISQYGAGLTTVVATGGVTMRSSAGNLLSPGQYSPMLLRKIATDEWYLWNGTSATTAAFTRTNGTYITTTLSGSMSGALNTAVDIAVDLTGVVPVSLGGTGVSSTTQTYTPTLTNTTNVSASTARACQYMRVGNTITVSGQLDIDPTTTSTATTLGISLPVASALTTAFQVGGTASSIAVTDSPAGIQGDATNDRAILQYICTDVTNHTMTFTFTYQVL